jgi:hypothetical protein
VVRRDRAPCARCGREHFLVVDPVVDLYGMDAMLVGTNPRGAPLGGRYVTRSCLHPGCGETRWTVVGLEQRGADVVRRDCRWCAGERTHVRTRLARVWEPEPKNFIILTTSLGWSPRWIEVDVEICVDCTSADLSARGPWLEHRRWVDGVPCGRCGGGRSSSWLRMRHVHLGTDAWPVVLRRRRLALGRLVFRRSQGWYRVSVCERCHLMSWRAQDLEHVEADLEHGIRVEGNDPAPPPPVATLGPYR